MDEKRTSSRKTRVGKVVSDKMDKTVVVAIEDRVAHPLYKKIVGRTYKLKAHDEQNSCGVGDKVKVMETRTSAGVWLRSSRKRSKEASSHDSAGNLSEGRRQHRRQGN